jgi:hypothetical protein
MNWLKPNDWIQNLSRQSLGNQQGSHGPLAQGNETHRPACYKTVMAGQHTTSVEAYCSRGTGDRNAEERRVKGNLFRCDATFRHRCDPQE